MFSHFLPSSVAEIQDVEAIALLQHLQRRVVQVPFQPGMTVCSRATPVEIATAYVHYTSHHSPSFPGTTPILLLHGFDSSLLEFRRLLPLLAESYETWAIDLFGSGFTEHIATIPVDPWSIRQHLLSVVETWIDQPVVLAGASLGGAVAIDFALHHPNWVHALVLMDSVGFSGSFPIGQFLPNELIELGADWLYYRQRAALAAASVLPMVNPTLIDTLRCSLLHQEMPGWKEAIASFTKSGGYSDLSDNITEVTHPTLLLWGKADDVLGTADATRLEQAISNSQLIWVEGAGHVPHFDQPQVVASHLLSFVRHTQC
jgi:pimeloyl-ACP methyl ester carboxylesterase